MAKRQTKSQSNFEVADSIMTTFVLTLRKREESKGTTSNDSALFTIGYLQSMMATFMAQHPQMMADVAHRLTTITKE